MRAEDRTVRIATAAYPVDRFDTWRGYADKIAAWIHEAADAEAELLVFPEYGTMEFAALGGAEVAADLEASIAEVARHLPKLTALLDGLARERGVHILAPTAPVFDGPGRPVNRAVFLGPEGPLGHQDKQIMTRFEREDWHIRAGGPLKIFEALGTRIGVLICYDSEFPLLARALVKVGCDILLTPSCTDTVAGHYRVRTAARARALEGQCVTVTACTVGAAPWCAAVDLNHGRAGIFGPPDHGFPPTGVLAESEMDVAGWTMGDVDPQAIREVRRQGLMLNHAHWPEQHARIGEVVFAADG